MIADLKPYPEYKEAGLPWLGNIPKHWHMVPNRAVMKDQRQVVGGRASDFTLLSLTLRGVIARDMKNPKGKFPAQFNTYKVVRPDDFVFCLFDIDETPRGVGLSSQRGMITGAYDVFSPLRNINPRFLYYYYLFVDEGKLMKPLYTGLRKTIQRGVFASLKAPLPSPPEQAAIVRFLDWANGRLERAVRAKRKVIALLREQKQAIMHSVVTRGLDPSVPRKPSGINWLDDIPQHWDVLPLKSVCAVQSGITLGKDYAGHALHEYPYLRVANVQAGHVNLSVVRTVRVTKAESLRCLLQKGDVLMTEGGDPDKLGRGCVWDSLINPCLHQNHVFAVRPDQSRLVPQFLSSLMATNYARAYFESTSKQTTNLASTNKTKIGMFKLLLPPLEEQTAALEAIETKTRPVNNAISRFEREIELLVEYRTCLVADIVTGKLDVRDAAQSLPAEEPLDAVEEDGELETELDAIDEEATA